MGIFESQKTKNKKLFLDVLQDIENKIRKVVDSKNACQLYLSWCVGAVSLALSLVEISPIKETWGKGDKEVPC